MIDATHDLVRLHITPFNDQIYDRIIPPSLANQITNLSLHATQTFPERGFGYVDMPRTEAEKLKKKLNGSTLKGAKIRIEEARPKEKRKHENEAPVAEDDGAAKRIRSGGNKRKESKVQGVLEGHELDSKRRVKRAWTDSTNTKPKDSDRKLLFRTTLPPTATPIASSTKTKSSRKESKDEAKKRRSGDKRTVIKEFAQHRKSFALGQDPSKDTKPAVEYVDGQGWVDEDGVVVEAAPRIAQARQPAVRSQSPVLAKIATRSKKQSSPMKDEVERDAPGINTAPRAAEPVRVEATSDQDDSENSDDVQSEADVDRNESKPSEQREIHPFEALYKKKASNEKNDDKLSLAPIDTSFNFFDAQDSDEGVVSETCPQTPHTKQEFEWRAQRSAAPTPDTAAIDGRFGSPFGDDDDDEDEDSEIDHDTTPRPAPAGLGVTTEATDPLQQEESAFRKYFFEHRGENDRAWKKKRREAKKQQRQRENRRLSRRVVV